VKTMNSNEKKKKNQASKKPDFEKNAVCGLIDVIRNQNFHQEFVFLESRDH